MGQWGGRRARAEADAAAVAVTYYPFRPPHLTDGLERKGAGQPSEVFTTLPRISSCSTKGSGKREGPQNVPFTLDEEEKRSYYCL